MGFQGKDWKTKGDMATEDLPPGIIEDILSRLGVRDLLRFRCVAKQWRSTIDDPDFISLHLTRSLKIGLLLLQDERLHWVDSLDSPDSAADLSRGGGRIVSACNGLVAVQFQTPGGVSILNPSTRRSWSVPLSGGFDSPEGWCGRREMSVIGFGYDPVGDDYKLLRFMRPESVAEVYGLRKSTAWKRVEGAEPYWEGFGEGNVSVNDALHWIITNADLSSPTAFRDRIVAFDLVTDEFRTVELPPLNKLGGEGYPQPYVSVAKLKDWLCMAARRDGGVQIAVWAMKEYGVAESWAKLFSIMPPFGLWYLVPLSYVDSVGGDDHDHDHDDEILMMTMGFSKQVVSYAVGTGRFKDVPITGARGFFRSGCVCVPSLLGWSDFGDPESSDQNYEDEPAEETGDLED